MTGYIDWPEPDQVYGADEAPAKVEGGAMLNLNEIQEVCEALDGRLGPQGWTLEGPYLYNFYSVYDSDGNCVHNGVREEAQFIARARTWLPALVAELRRARAKIDAQAAELRNIRPEVERLRGARAAHGNAILDSAGVLCIEEADDAQLE